MNSNQPVGILIERTILQMKKELEEGGPDFGIDDIIKRLREDTRSEQTVKDAAENRFISTINWERLALNRWQENIGDNL